MPCTSCVSITHFVVDMSTNDLLDKYICAKPEGCSIIIKSHNQMFLIFWTIPVCDNYSFSLSSSEKILKASIIII